MQETNEKKQICMLYNDLHMNKILMTEAPRHLFLRHFNSTNICLVSYNFTHRLDAKYL